MCVHLLSTVNSDYVIPFRVAVHSLVAKKLPQTRVQWHVSQSGLSLADRAEIESHQTDSNMEFIWHDLGGVDLTALPVRGRAIAKMYERLLIPEALAGEVARFIYLDGDLLILDRIEALWEVDLDGAIIAAVQDLAVPLVSSPMGLRRYRELGFSRQDPYFNAGVYVVDVEAWRKHRISAGTLDYLERYERSINLMDQDALNAVIQNRWKPLDYRWNLTAGLVARAHHQPKQIDVAQLERAVANPAIVHFSGYLKPWILARLGSRWASDYERALFEVFPGHRFDSTLRARSCSFYDRALRTYFYALEKTLWKTMRGF